MDVGVRAFESIGRLPKGGDAPVTAAVVGTIDIDAAYEDTVRILGIDGDGIVNPTLATNAAFPGGADVGEEGLIARQQGSVQRLGIVIGDTRLPGVRVAVGGGAVDTLQRVSPFHFVVAVAGGERIDGALAGWGQSQRGVAHGAWGKYWLPGSVASGIAAPAAVVVPQAAKR